MNEKTGPKAAPRQSSPRASAPATRQQAVEAALRDLIWRVDHVRSNLQSAVAEASARELGTLLDTSDAHAALGLNGADIQGSDRND